jgi:ribosomal protein S18 acetylase RimI-like enzyme
LIRPTRSDDTAAIMSILEASGQFDADSRAFVQETLERHLKNSSPAIWLTADDGEPVGVAYCAPEAVASGTWNLLMLWTRPDKHGQGFGSQLVAQLESELTARAARLLLVETSGLPAFAAARSFYAKLGFSHEATIKNFFAEGDDKMVFTKALAKHAT